MEMKENFNIPIKEETVKKPGDSIRKEDFAFSAQDIIKELESKDIKYIGTGTSDFQAQPLIFDENGKPKVMSDWEMLIVNAQNQEGKHIHTESHLSDLPKFLEKSESYIKRSQETNMNMFRFSLDFGRLCPSAGEFDEKMMGDYVKALALVKAHGQEPMLAMYHWPMPKYLLKMNEKSGKIEAGGWEHPDVAEHFNFYVKSVLAYLSNDDKVRTALNQQGFSKDDQDKFLSEGLVRHFLSINEPSTFMTDSYMVGVFPPFKKGKFSLIKEVTEKLINSHDFIYSELKSGKYKTSEEEAQVGVAHNWTYFDGLLSKHLQNMNEDLMKKFERDGNHSDFIGLQYYLRATVPSLYPPMPLSRLPKPFNKLQQYREPREAHYSDHPDFGDIYPEGIYHHLVRINEMYPKKEIFVTEFGFSDKKDLRRPYWILETLRYVLEAKKSGVPIRGMLLWSLVNNFEWDRGMEQKIGLFEEKDLDKPLKSSEGEGVQGWEAWQSVAAAVAQPSEENIQALQKTYEKAKQQFSKLTGTLL